MERKRPQTRGVANPVDHPHGVVKEKLLVEKSSFTLSPIAKGLKTENLRSDKLIITRRKKENK